MSISSCRCIYGRESIRRGELFVYTNKKNLARKDGQVSALLHLDMEHLGPLDVYVALKDTKVSTKFYVQNDAILDYLEANMDVLTERLQTGTVAQIIELGEAAERRKAGFDRPEALSALTEREYEIVRLMAQRLNNREIAEKAVSVRGQYPAVCESNLHQTADSRRAACESASCCSTCLRIKTNNCEGFFEWFTVSYRYGEPFILCRREEVRIWTGNTFSQSSR